MLHLGRLCGLMPASTVVAEDEELVAGLLVGVEQGEGASAFVSSSSVDCFYMTNGRHDCMCM